MALLESKNLFLDTHYFVSAFLNFDSIALRKLIRLVKAGRIKVFLTSITVDEVKNQIRDRVTESVPHLEKARDKAKWLRNVSGVTPLFTDFKTETALQELREQFEKLLVDLSATVVVPDKVDVSKVFGRYHAGKRPFDAPNKKFEFPDAFAQATLEQWCADAGEKMYVVSGDSDWLSLLNEPQTALIPRASLEEVLDLAIKDEQEREAELALKVYRAHLPAIEAAIKKEFSEAGFYVEDTPGHVDGVEITAFQMDEPNLVLTEGDNAVFNVVVTLTFVAEASFENTDNGIWDSEEKTWIYLPTDEVEAEEETTFGVDLIIEYDADHPERAPNIACILDKTDFGVTVFPTDYELK